MASDLHTALAIDRLKEELEKETKDQLSGVVLFLLKIGRFHQHNRFDDRVMIDLKILPWMDPLCFWRQFHNLGALLLRTSGSKSKGRRGNHDVFHLCLGLGATSGW